MHGTPDFGNVVKQDNVYQLNDLAEQAERLGAIPSIDRLGTVIFLEDFIDGINKWDITLTGAGNIARSSGYRFFHGGWSCYLYLPANAGNNIQLLTSIPYPLTTYIGIEFCANINQFTTQFIGYAQFYTGVYCLTFGIKVDIPNGNVYLLNNVGSWVLVNSSAYLYYGDIMFHHVKYVVSLPDLTYIRWVTTSASGIINTYTPYITLSSDVNVWIYQLMFMVM